MAQYRVPLLIAGIALLVFAGIWKFGLSERWQQRFPDGWTWEVNFLGTALYADETGEYPADKEFPVDDDLSRSERYITISDEDAPEGAVKIEDHYTSYDANTNAVTWDYTYTALVDPETGRHIEEPYRSDYFIFPRNVEKTTYHIRNTSYQGLPLAFQAEEEIEGLTTYHFLFQDEMDNTAAYPDQPLEDNQAIRCVDMRLEFWVEPLTGEVVKYFEGCSGDYVYDTETDENLFGLTRWSGTTTGDDVIRRANVIRSQRRTLLWTGNYIPLLLAAAGVVATGAGAYGLLSKRPA